MIMMRNCPKMRVSESESDSGGDNDEGLKIKKVQQETWIEDNKSYNVTFVGTSVWSMGGYFYPGVADDTQYVLKALDYS
jgi:hypothetical protein